MTLRPLAAAMMLMLPMACAMAAPDEPETLPVMRWDHRPEADIWTERVLTSLERHDERLAHSVPHDIETWCPGYENAGLEERRAFWAAMFSALAKHESTWNPQAAGGGGKWIGLVQIDPRTARGYGCAATTVSELKDGAANLSCAVRIAAAQVPRDNMVAGNGRQGLGRDWAPFRSASKRAEMAEWVRSQDYCRG